MTGSRNLTFSLTDLEQAADSREADDVMSYRSAIAYNEQR
jgi:hypothetical protein